jgi:hypothetical protein
MSRLLGARGLSAQLVSVSLVVTVTIEPGVGILYLMHLSTPYHTPDDLELLDPPRALGRDIALHA